jgi:hypothetical protein
VDIEETRTLWKMAGIRVEDLTCHSWPNKSGTSGVAATGNTLGMFAVFLADKLCCSETAEVPVLDLLF